MNSKKTTIKKSFFGRLRTILCLLAAGLILTASQPVKLTVQASQPVTSTVEPLTVTSQAARPVTSTAHPLTVTSQATPPVTLTSQAAQSSTGTTSSSTSLETAGISRASQSSITISITPDEWYVAGTIFRLYKVADLNDDLTFRPTDKFQDIVAEPGDTDTSKINVQPVGISTDAQAEATASQWMSTAAALISAVRSHQIAEDAAQPMENKSCTFDLTWNTNGTAAQNTGKGLGLYLIQGDTAREGNRTVTYQPILICIPQNYNTSSNTRMPGWLYQIQSYVKSADPTYTSNPHHHGGDTPDTPTNPSPPSTPSKPTNGGGQEGSTESSSESSSESTSTGSSTGSSAGTGETGSHEDGGGGSTGHRNSRTGDESQLPLYLTVMAVAAAILLIYFLAIRAGKRREARQAKAERKAETVAAAKAESKAETATAAKAEGKADNA